MSNQPANFNIDQTLEALERRRLDTATPNIDPVWGLLDGSTLFRVLAQAVSGKPRRGLSPIDYEQYMETGDGFVRLWRAVACCPG
jgi:hypothetical protein